MENIPARQTQSQRCLTCLQAVVLGAVDRQVLGSSPRPVAHSVGHPVVKADGGGLRQQRVLRQHVCPQAVTWGPEERERACYIMEQKKKLEIAHISTVTVNYNLGITKIQTKTGFV